MKDATDQKWATAELASVSMVFTDGNWIETKDQALEGIRLVQTGNVGEGVFKDRRDKARWIDDQTFDRLNCFEVLPGDCLVSRLPDPVGRACIIPETGDKMITAVDCTVIRPDEAKIDPQFFVYYSQSSEYLRNVDDRCTGTTRRRISRKNLGKIPIPLPPLEEQQRIVAVLDEAFEGLARARAHAEANLQNARELFGAELASVCKANAEEYGTVSLAEISEEITDGDHMPPPKAQEGVPFVTIKNIDKETHNIDFSDTFKVPETYYQELKDKRKPRLRDVLYTVTGSFGIPVLVQAEQRFCFQRHIGLIRPRQDISPEWLYFVLASPFVFEQADAGATGTAQRTVSLKLLRSMVVPFVPSELQAAIAERFRGIHSEASRLAANYQAKLQDLDDLRQSLLQKAFAGELT